MRFQSELLWCLESFVSLLRMYKKNTETVFGLKSSNLRLQLKIVLAIS